MVRGLASPDRNVRTIAGILLVRGGAKAEPILLEALRDHNNPEMVLRVLGDVASTRAKPSILPFAEDSDPKIADAAKDALKIIDLRAQYQAGLKSTPGKPSYQQ
jgi:HEAT repeat protein